MVTASTISNFHSYLCEISDQAEGYIGKGIMDISTYNIDPIGTVSGVTVCAVKAHHMG